MTPKKLIVNADDFGQSLGINKGIIQAHEQGIVTSASLMVRYPAIADAVAYSKSHPALGVGLHLDLGEWFYSDGEWKALYEVVNLQDAEAVRNEVYCQLDLFKQLVGNIPTHIDSHQHVHLRENVLPIIKEVAQQLDVTLRRCSKQVKYCGEFYGQTNDGFPYHVAIGVEALMKTIEATHHGITEVACHPGFADDMQTMYKTERAIEVATLCNSQIRKVIEEADIQLCSFEHITF